jgi:hypothetical protein
MGEPLDITADDFAAWLEQQGKDRFWTVEGEAQIEQSIGLPATAAELARLIRARSGTLRIFAPQVQQTPRPSLGVLRDLAYGTGDEVIVRAAWLRPDSSSGPQWLILRDLLAEEANQTAHA